MLRVAYQILKDFGVLGVTLIQFGVILWGGWKLFTNHLHHIQLGIDKNTNEIKKVDAKLGNVCERVANIEGQLK